MEILTRKILFVMKTNMAVLKKPRRPEGSGSRSKASGKKIIKKVKRLNGSGSRLKASREKVVRKITSKKVSVLDLKRSKQNPIIEPVSHKYWESKATFNPSAILHDGKVHIIYRAIGDSDHSVLGYRGSNDGFTMSDSFPHPVYFHYLRENKDKSLPSISYSSGGGWGGGC